MNLLTDKAKILEAGLKNVPFDGWTMETFELAAIDAGYDRMMVKALFPRGERDLIDFFAQWADEKMMAALVDCDIEQMKIRDRIKLAVETRIAILNPHKESAAICFKKLILPQNARLATSLTWRSADIIWIWAGDTSDDYNRYTKRLLLGGVIGTSLAYWFQDQSENHEKTLEFLNRRIENVLFVGKNAGKIIKPFASLTNRFIVPKLKHFNCKKQEA